MRYKIMRLRDYINRGQLMRCFQQKKEDDRNSKKQHTPTKGYFQYSLNNIIYRIVDSILYSIIYKLIK